MSFPQAKAHPWHGVSAGKSAPQIVNAFIEIVPTDTVKYEVDKETGHLRIDRPQRFSSQCPTLYGFVPRTYCGELVGKRCSDAVKRKAIMGDGDPLDICVFTDRPITHGDILLEAIPIGGLRMIDAAGADDKILAVLKDDPLYGSWNNLSFCPQSVLQRLQHYFLTYKDLPGASSRKVEIPEIYDAEEARAVISASQADYEALVRKSG